MPRQISSLTALRFVAAILVVIHHEMDFSLQPVHVAAIERGGLAVDFFFILSGFVLTHVYQSTFEQGFGAVPSFLVARLARIYPVHLLILGLFAGLTLLSAAMGLPINAERFGLNALLAHLALVDAWGFETTMTWNYPAWSISAEWAAYLLFPLLVTGLARLRPAPALAVMAVVWLLVGTLFHLPQRTVDFAVARIIPEFIMGILVYRLWPPIQPLRFAQSQFVVLFLALAAGISFGLPDVWMVLGFVYLIALAPSVGGLTGQILSAPWFVRLGAESYSLYMVHILVFSVFYNLMKLKRVDALIPNAHAKDIVAILLAVAAAKLLHRFVELPAQRLVRGLWEPGRRGPRASTGLGITS